MNRRDLSYTGERLVPDDERLKRLLVEDLAKFRFVSRYATGRLVLDAGCGAGQGTAYLASHGADYAIGMDIALDAVRYARTHYAHDNLAFVAVNGQYLPFRTGQFDLVSSIEVIEHLPEPELYVAEIRRVLRPGGMLVLSTPNKLISSPAPGTLWPYHIHEFHPEELEMLLRKYLGTVEMWGMGIPVYDQHPMRRLMHRLAPLFKPMLPHRLRVSVLPALQRHIKPELSMDDVVIEQANYRTRSTLMAVCSL